MRTFVSLGLARLCREERGQTMAEYGVVLALVTLAVVGAMTMLSSNIGAALEAVGGILP
jgi:pilus assembly protein Flp/PilA